MTGYLVRVKFESICLRFWQINFFFNFAKNIEKLFRNLVASNMTRTKNIFNVFAPWLWPGVDFINCFVPYAELWRLAPNFGGSKEPLKSRHRVRKLGVIKPSSSKIQKTWATVWVFLFKHSKLYVRFGAERDGQAGARIGCERCGGLGLGLMWWWCLSGCFNWIS